MLPDRPDTVPTSLRIIVVLAVAALTVTTGAAIGQTAASTADPVTVATGRLGTWSAEADASDRLAAQGDRIEHAREIADGLRSDAEEEPTTRAASAARRVTELQAAQLGAGALPDAGTCTGTSTRAALVEMTERLEPDAARRLAASDLSGLETLPDAVDERLACLVQAVTAYRAVADDVYGPDLEARPAGDDLGRILAARVRVVEAATAFARTWDGADLATTEDHIPLDRFLDIRAPAVFAIDLVGHDSTYDRDYVFILDVGGDDRYADNAGGSRVCYEGGERRPKDVLHLPYCPSDGDDNPAAALVDLSGSDSYGSGSKGVAGGGYRGAGLLLDLGVEVAVSDETRDDHDRRRQETCEDNAATLLACEVTCAVGEAVTEDACDDHGPAPLPDDIADGDVYGGTIGAVGGGADLGVGFLLDVAGDDAYRGTVWGEHDRGANGGAHGDAVGTLVDLDGDDRYRADGYGSNGGADRHGHGFLVDVAGQDIYSPAGEATLGFNGGGARGGDGLLLDLAGADDYHGEERGVNGGGYDGGRGLLLDLGVGETVLREGFEDGTLAPLSSRDGGWVVREIFDHMRPLDGTQAAYCESWDGCSGDVLSLEVDLDQPSTITFGLHLEELWPYLEVSVDGEVLDRIDGPGYRWTRHSYLLEPGVHTVSWSVPPGGWAYGVFLEDLQVGSPVPSADRYVGTDLGVNGGADRDYESIGTLVDVAGPDRYLAESGGVNGGVDLGLDRSLTAYGLLVDGAGTDRYREAGRCADWAAGRDRTVLPKGVHGAQIDSTADPGLDPVGCLASG